MAAAPHCRTSPSGGRRWQVIEERIVAPTPEFLRRHGPYAAGEINDRP